MGRVSRRTVDHPGNLGEGEVWTPQHLLQEFRLESWAGAAAGCFTAALLVGDLELSTFANVLEEVFENLRGELLSLVGAAPGVAVAPWSVNAAAACILSQLVGWLTPVWRDTLLEAHAVGIRVVDGALGGPVGGAGVPFRTEVLSGCGGEGEYAIWLDWRVGS